MVACAGAIVAEPVRRRLTTAPPPPIVSRTQASMRSRGRTSVQRPPAHSGGGDDRDHLVAVAAERDRLHVAGRNTRGGGDRVAKAAGVQRGGHPDHPFGRLPAGAPQLVGHLVERIGDHDRHRLGRELGDRLGGASDHGAVDRRQGGAVHARSPRSPGGDHDHVAAADQIERGPAAGAGRRAGDPGGVLDVQRDRRGQAGHDVDQADLVGHPADGRQVRGRRPHARRRR